MDIPQPTQNLALIIGASGIDVIGVPDGSPEARTTTPGRIRIFYGGIARNVAENLAHLGQPVSLITAVGEDALGMDILEHLRKAGVDISGCVRCDACNTGVYLAILSDNGERTIALADRRNVDQVSPESINRQSKTFQQAGMVFLDANLSPETIRAVMKLARKFKVPVCADPASTSLATRLIPFLPQIEIITPNAQEAAALLGWPNDPLDLPQTMLAARSLLDMGVKTALITMGEKGVCYSSAETNGHIPSILTNVVDPTGAGDSLTSVVIYAYLNGISVDDGIRLGVSAASLTLREYGPINPNLSLETIYENLVI